MQFDELFRPVKNLTIQSRKQNGNKIYKLPDNLGYLVNKSYKIITKRGHFSDRKLQNGYKNHLGSYKPHTCKHSKKNLQIVNKL